jgi:hypothetical protein
MQICFFREMRNLWDFKIESNIFFKFNILA